MGFSFWVGDAHGVRLCQARRMEREPKRGDAVEKLMIAALALVTIAGAAASIWRAWRVLTG